MNSVVAGLAVLLVAACSLLAGLAVLRSLLSALVQDGLASQDWDAERGELEDERRRSLKNLHEIQFDFESGKLDDKDYALLHQRYERRALRAMKALDAASGSTSGSAAASAAQGSAADGTP